MKSHRNVYLKMKTLNEAREIVFKHFRSAPVLSSEIVSVPDAVGRVLSEPVTARLSSPGFHSAAMDGIAVRAASSFGASEGRPRRLKMGVDAFNVNTGHVMPENTDAVIMIEQVHVLDPQQIEIEAPVFPWQNVRKMGEDIVATELLFPRNHVITPYCVGALLSGGIFSVPVKERPRIFIIPTGTELVDWHHTAIESLRPGQIVETNAYVMGTLTEASGGCYTRHDILADDLEKIKQAVAAAIEADFHIILIIGGSSAGSEDYARDVISDLGAVLVHGVTIMPGKPVIIGDVRSKPVIGIPGYPVSAIVAFEQFVDPIICRLLGKPDRERTTIMVEPTKKIASKLGVEEFLRVKLGAVGDKIVATPLPRGAGCITSITEADGIIRIPNNVEGLKEFEPVPAELLRPLSSVKNTIVVVGSHDMTLDVLADQIRATHSHLSISSSHVGSLGGLMAIKKGVCHVAGSHLLDPENGTYNISYIQKYLSGDSPPGGVRLVQLVFRDQGLIIAPGNPKNIKGIEDLVRDDVVFINRQAGSGTRILLDYRLKELGLNAAEINGYETDEFTHMSVAVAVLSGSVDAGLGIFAAARALGLDFIPVVTERYDLVIPQMYMESENIRILLETIHSPAFKQRVEALGGYSTRQTGEIIY